jgi:hypothetical protein
MEKKLIPLEKESPVLKLYTGNYEKSLDLKSKLDSLEIKLNENYEPPKVAWEYRNDETGTFKPIGTIDNFSLVIGKAKAKKSFFVGMAISTALSKDIFQGRFRSNLSLDKNDILYFDTEQSSYHVQMAINRICKQLKINEPKNLYTYGLRKLSPEERLEIIEFAIYNNPKVGFVVIDGIKDLINSINDEKEATIMANKLLKWTEDNHIHIVTVLHQNKADNNARGHIGTELINKAETVVTVTVDSTENSKSVVEPKQCRNLPFDAFAFQINDSGIPELVDDFVKSSSKADNFDLLKVDIEDKINLLKKAFEDSESLQNSELLDNIKSAYKTLYKKNLGNNKIKQFIPHCREIGLLSQKKLRAPYFLSSSFFKD